MEKHPYKTDIAVLILFFNRPAQLRQLFAEVKRARPSRLFLYQDGPRGSHDVELMSACRSVVSDASIDWVCDVRRNYCLQNRGCDPSNYLAQRWAFSLADKCIVFEDDDVPSQSFFPFCKEMLDRYEHDERVMLVSGFNEDEVSPDCRDSYFFTSSASIWGWASWRRVVDQWEGDYAFLDDPQAVQMLEHLVKRRGYRRNCMRAFRQHKASGKEYYESILWPAMLLQSGLAIMPTQNQISNIGLTDDSTHFSGSLRTTPRAYRRIFEMRRFEMSFPLRHPRYVVDHVAYQERLYKRHAWDHPWIKVARSLEELWLNLRHGNFSAIGKAVRRRVGILLHGSQHV